MRSFTALMALAGLIPMPARSSGYSNDMNERIWALRLEAQRYATQAAAQQCSQSPADPLTYSDQIDPENKARDSQLFEQLMAMLRLDQNARAISIALQDHKSRALTKQVDAENLINLKKLIDIYGFPTTEAVGDQGVNAALMLIAHADQDIAFQKDVLNKMENEVSTGRLRPVIPMMLKSIRPQVTGQGKPLHYSPPDRPRQVNPRSSDCYVNQYNEFINVFVAQRFRLLSSPEANVPTGKVNSRAQSDAPETSRHQ